MLRYLNLHVLPAIICLEVWYRAVAQISLDARTGSDLGSSTSRKTCEISSYSEHHHQLEKRQGGCRYEHTRLEQRVKI